MFNRGQNKFTTSALLQKVSSQLRGEKVPDVRTSQQIEEDDLNSYLSTLTHKKAPDSQPQWDKYGDVDDLSSNQDTNLAQTSPKPTPTANRFLKKKTPQAQPKRKSPESRAPQPVKQSPQPVKQSALSKSVAYSSQYSAEARDRGGHARGISSVLSDSDLDLGLSPDEDVIADVRSWKKGGSSTKPSLPSRTSYTVDSDDSSAGIGHGGQRFLKKKTPQPQKVKNSPRNNKENIPHKSKAKSSAITLKSAEKYSTRVVLDTDEESLRGYISDLSASDGLSPATRAPRKGKSVSPAHSTPRSASMDNISEENEDYRGRLFMAPDGPESDNESVSSADNFKLNVMGLGDISDLEPALELKPGKTKRSASTKTVTRKDQKKKKTRGKEEEDIFGRMGLQTVDDLLGSSQLSIHTQSIASEIQTENVYDSDYDPASRSAISPLPLKSILATPRSGNVTPRSARSRVRYAEEDIMHIRSRSPSPEVISTARDTTSAVYTESFNTVSVSTETAHSVGEEDRSPTETEDYTEDFSAVSSQSSPELSPRSPRSSPRSTHRDSENYYSDDFTMATQTSARTYSRSSSRDSFSESGASYSDSRSRTPSPERKPRKSVSTRTREVQTGMDMGLLYHWNTQTAGSAVMGPQYGMAFVDPTPIASHVVGADALEALTAFSPSVLALNDMLRQQLAMTTHFLETQNRLHVGYVGSVRGDYQYTTLEDTKKFIKKNKPRAISFKEALKQVKAEMGLK